MSKWWLADDDDDLLTPSGSLVEYILKINMKIKHVSYFPTSKNNLSN